MLTDRMLPDVTHNIEEEARGDIYNDLNANIGDINKAEDKERYFEAI